MGPRQMGLLKIRPPSSPGQLIGYNRTEHGKAAGLRTTLVVCLAVSFCDDPEFALPAAGRSPDSFVTNDLMGVPLGILTGVGFIDAGVIIRRNNIVVGVTTAPTLWSMTVVGLCLGGGQIELDVVWQRSGFLRLAPTRLDRVAIAPEKRRQLCSQLDGEA
jgi:putative Mg2+ transporter-C (MgtC) family protein